MRGNSWIFFLILFQACGRNEVSPDKYLLWMKDYQNGLHQKKEVSNYVFDIQYKPYEYIVLNENRNLNKDPKKYSERIKELNGMLYFTLKISKTDSDLIKVESNDPAEYNRRLYYFLFRFKNDIYLLDGDKKYPCAVYHFERSYDLVGTKTFVLGFSSSVLPNTTNKTLVIDSREIGVGVTKFLFKDEDFKNIPLIKE